MRTKAAVVCALAGMFLAALPPSGRPCAAEGNDQGKSLYESKCSLCHGDKGNGQGPAGASLSPPPADFTQPGFWNRMNEKKIADTVRNGRGMMPAFDLSPEQIKDIVAYMSATFKKK